MKKIEEFLIHFLRRLLFFTTNIIIGLICILIFIVTYEPMKWKTVTKRKIRRIKRLTKFKLWMWRHFRWYFEFIHDDAYYKKLEEKLS